LRGGCHNDGNKIEEQIGAYMGKKKHSLTGRYSPEKTKNVIILKYVYSKKNEHITGNVIFCHVFCQQESRSGEREYGVYASINQYWKLVM